MVVGREFFTWVGQNVPTTSRGWTEVSKYANKFTKLGIFEWQVKDTTGHIYNMNNVQCGPPTSQELSFIQQYPNIQWYISIQALGGTIHPYNSSTNPTGPDLAPIWTNQNGAQDTFLADLETMLQTYTWCAGIDLDFEQGGGSQYISQATAFFQRVYNLVKQYGKKLNVDLPGMTADGSQGGSIGGENWCSYSQLAPYFDTCVLMTYGYSWVGSAPGAMTPANWANQVYTYATSVIHPASKIYLGQSGYGTRWAIHTDQKTLRNIVDSHGNHDYTPTTDSMGQAIAYRGVQSSYYNWLYWICGANNHYDESGGTQPYIPWAAFWDDNQKSAYMYLDIYDYQTIDDIGLSNTSGFATQNGQMPSLNYNGDDLMVAYNKKQTAYFPGLVVDQTVTQNQTTYTFSVPSTGSYDIVLKVNFPWFKMNKIVVEIDGQQYTAQQPTDWYPLARTAHWYYQAFTMTLSAGTHTLVYDTANSAPGAQLLGFRVCSGGQYSFTMSGGQVNATMVPQQYIDINGNQVQPRNGYVLTLEVLRRKPEYALIWADSWQGYTNGINDVYSWYSHTGAWSLSGNPAVLIGGSNSTLTLGTTTLGLYSFGEICVWADFSFTGPEAGIIIGPHKVGIDSSGNIKVDGAVWWSNVANPHVTNELRVRNRQGVFTVYLNGSLIGSFTSTNNSSTFGLYTASGATMTCTQLNAGDSYTYMPQEAVTVTVNGTPQTLGRIQRNSNATWLQPWNYFQVPNGVEEKDTRVSGQDISLDYDYMNTASIPLASTIPATIDFTDTGVWIRTLFLCDQDGASIAYYCDQNSFLYWQNQAEQFGCAGTAFWVLGLEDPKIFNYIPDQW
jgi:spore germination protein YaaH